MPYTDNKAWQLVVLITDIVCIGVQCDEAMILHANYLPAKTKPKPPQNMLAAECARQIRAYFKQPRKTQFDLPLATAPTAHQQRVREVISAIPAGQTMTYGGVAKRLKNSSPRAVGGACRANHLPLIVPCHRVVAANGVGGFMGDDGKTAVSIKHHLLHLEGVK